MNAYLWVIAVFAAWLIAAAVGTVILVIAVAVADRLRIGGRR